MALTACGAKHDPVSKAAGASSAKGSEHVVVDGDVKVGSQAVKLTGTGEFQAKPRLGRIALLINGTAVRASVDEVLQGSTIYMRSPLFARALPVQKNWISLDLKHTGHKLGINYGQFAQTDPTDTLRALSGASSVTKIGAATIDGVSTTHYRATVNFSKILNGQKLQKFSDVQSTPVEVWIDGSQLIRRLKLHYTATAAGTTASSTLVMDLSHYGEQVHVQVPSASQTVEMSTLGGG